MRASCRCRSGLLLALALVACGDGRIDISDNTAVPMGSDVAREHCLDHVPLREAFFGDLHVHTSFSSDGWTWGVRLTPDDAYRYAFGEPVRLPPNDASGARGTREVRIDRPLDFAAVTDHAEFLAEGRFCTDPESEAYDSDFCTEYRPTVGRSMKLAMRIFSPIPWRDDDMCGDDGATCAAAVRGIWRETVDAAERWNDTGVGCERTTFIGYEYSSHRMGSNLHRNVIFRNHVVPPIPVSYVEAPREWKLWESLEADCLESGTGCDVLAIPHNSNISNGRMFAVDYPGAGSEEEQAERAALRARVERLVEIMQHKGDSECRTSVPNVLGAEDELCAFEKFEEFTPRMQGESCYEGPGADLVPHLGPDCISRLSYVRYALTEGLKEEARIGVNPFRFGITASTDTHNAIGGGVDERSYPGHIGLGDDTVEKRTSWSTDIAGNASNSPGGLTGVWAEENSREAVFAAMQRKEVFGTSGPRIRPRFFGGWAYDESLCNDPQLLELAYAGGVPMGRDLPTRGDGNAPVFLATALADPGTADQPGTPLQRLQLIKGWVDDDGVSQQRVFEIAGDPANGASVDLDTCETGGRGASQLCTVWRDPEFDPARRAVYYVRAVENPTCRYSAWQCASLPPDERPEDCARPEVRRAIQERAWTSPIWYTPASET